MVQCKALSSVLSIRLSEPGREGDGGAEPGREGDGGAESRRELQSISWVKSAGVLDCYRQDKDTHCDRDLYLVLDKQPWALVHVNCLLYH